MGNLNEIVKESDGSLPAYAWPGGYPILYFTQNGLTVCPKCAMTETSDPVTDYFIHWEGTPEQCEDCNVMVESAYGEVDQEG